MLEIFKMSSKTGDRFTAISDLQNKEECVLFQTGNCFEDQNSVIRNGCKSIPCFDNF